MQKSTASGIKRAGARRLEQQHCPAMTRPLGIGNCLVGGWWKTAEWEQGTTTGSGKLCTGSLVLPRPVKNLGFNLNETPINRLSSMIGLSFYPGRTRIRNHHLDPFQKCAGHHCFDTHTKSARLTRIQDPFVRKLEGSRMCQHERFALGSLIGAVSQCSAATRNPWRPSNGRVETVLLFLAACQVAWDCKPLLPLPRIVAILSRTWSESPFHARAGNILAMWLIFYEGNYANRQAQFLRNI